MQTQQSPTKRRALAPLNANAMPSPRQTLKAATAAVVSSSSSSSPIVKVALDQQSRKRSLDVVDAGSPSGKKACLERDEYARSRSHSPDTSSVFDTSANDASWATLTTEPDVAERITPPVRSRPRGLTREQAREKAEILRLRLGLASYKVRTGQTTVPLAQLQARPLPPKRVRVQSPHSSHEKGQDGGDEQQSSIEETRSAEDNDDDDEGVLPERVASDSVAAAADVAIIPSVETYSASTNPRGSTTADGLLLDLGSNSSSSSQSSS